MFLLIALVFHPRYKLQFMHWLTNQSFDNEATSSLKEKRDSSLKLIFEEYNGERGRFPILANMAKDFLTIPISTMTSKSTFGIGGRVLDLYHSVFTPRMVETLICMQDWLKGTSSPLFSNENKDFEELEKFEQSNKLDLFYTTLLYYILIII
uniref:AC transposase n=1 Tax=Cajanus cajan TaxID=3821 RepID=A0A151SZ22_CAJCA|nr:Putative AC transposase [Cajanus cajan]